MKKYSLIKFRVSREPFDNGFIITFFTVNNVIEKVINHYLRPIKDMPVTEMISYNLLYQIYGEETRIQFGNVMGTNDYGNIFLPVSNFEMPRTTEVVFPRERRENFTNLFVWLIKGISILYVRFIFGGFFTYIIKILTEEDDVKRV